MSDDFLNALREPPRPEFARELRVRLRALESSDERPLARRRILVFASVAALLLVVGSLAFPSVRERVREVLDLFREHDVIGARFEPSRFEDLRARIGERSPLLLTFGDPEVLEESGPPAVYPTLAAARAATGLAPGTFPAPPPGMVLERVEILDAGRERLRVDRERLVDVLDRLDLVEVGVPRSLAEGSLELYHPRRVTLCYADGERHVRLTQGESPGLRLSSGLDVSLLGEIGLRVLGIEDTLAHGLAGSIDWGATLVVPLPAGAAAFEPVAIQGRQGLLVSAAPGATARTLLWSDAGRLRTLSGTLEREQLLQLAASLP